MIAPAQTGAAPVIVPVGATEQHGPNGLIGTDHMTAEVRGCCAPPDAAHDQSAVLSRVVCAYVAIAVQISPIEVPE